MTTQANTPPKDAVIRLHSTEKRSTPVIVNRRQVDVPHNQDFPLAGPYIEALTNSRANFTVVRDLKSGETAAGADAETALASTATNPDSPAAIFNQEPGGDALRHLEPQVPAGLVVREEGRQNDQVPGGDSLSHVQAAPGEASTGEERALAEEQARETAQASAEGTLEPAVVITRTEPDPPAVEQSSGLEAEMDRLQGRGEGADKRDPLDRDNDGGKGGSVSYAKILEGTVPEVLAAAEKLAPDQRKRLRAAEDKGQKRKGVLDGIDALSA